MVIPGGGDGEVVGPGVGVACAPDPDGGVVGVSPTTLLPGTATTTRAGLAATARRVGLTGTTLLIIATGAGVGLGVGAGVGAGVGLAPSGVGDRGASGLPAGPWPNAWAL